MYKFYDPRSDADDWFVEERLMVRVKRRTKKLIVKDLPTLDMGRLRSNQDQFAPGRLVGNFVLVSLKTPKIIEPVLDPPIEIHITYDTDDIDRLKKAYAAYQAAIEAGQSPAAAPRATVGYWDKTRWVLFTVEDHDLIWDPAEPTLANNWTPAEAIVKITYWPDPPIAAGPP